MDTKTSEPTPEMPDKDVRSLAYQSLGFLSFESIDEEEVDLSPATRLPISELSTLGSGLMSVLEGSRTVAQTVEASGKDLLFATDVDGNPLDIARLFNAKDGSGSLGGYVDDAKRLSQARFHRVADEAIKVTTKIPTDPATLLMAATIMEINHKLEGISEDVQAMSRYIKDQDHAKLRGNLDTLNGLISSYRYNWDNETFRQSMHIKVMDIKQDASQQIVLHRKQVEAISGGKSKKGLDRQLSEVRDGLGQYRLANYLYAFSTFAEVMLQENFDSDYLDTVVDDLDEHSLAYIAFYTKTFDAMDAKADDGLGAKAMDTLSRATWRLGKAVEQSPIGSMTQLDEALIKAGGNIDTARRSRKKEQLRPLVEARSSEIRPFIESLEAIGELYRSPVILLADREAVYLLPAEG